MQYHIITIFPDVFVSFLSTSLIAKAQDKKLISVALINPRDFCIDTQQQVDDEIYGWGHGLLLKAQPIIDAVRHIQSTLSDERRVKVALLWPSKEIFTQAVAHELVDAYTDIILICGRYEGVDHRVNLRCQQEFGDAFSVLSLGRFVTLGGEIPAMVMIEATARLLPGVIKETASRQQESYRPEQGLTNIEHPQYTRPDQVEWFTVPEVLLSGHHQKIEEWKENMSE